MIHSSTTLVLGLGIVNRYRGHRNCRSYCHISCCRRELLRILGVRSPFQHYARRSWPFGVTEVSSQDLPARLQVSPLWLENTAHLSISGGSRIAPASSSGTCDTRSGGGATPSFDLLKRALFRNCIDHPSAVVLILRQQYCSTPVG